MRNRRFLFFVLIVVPLITCLISIVHGSEKIIQGIAYVYMVGFGVLVLSNISKRRSRRE